jgi:type II secretory ATPase GspE/PulE/Tfp pilus assembly ATPase PilB-like protein
VLSTLHTNDAPSAITRLLDLGVPTYLINATLLGVMAQRLVRTLCPRLQGRRGNALRRGNVADADFAVARPGPPEDFPAPKAASNAG